MRTFNNDNSEEKPKYLGRGLALCVAGAALFGLWHEFGDKLKESYGDFRVTIGAGEFPALNELPLEVVTTTYTPVACQLAAGAKGCAAFPIPVMHITNDGPDIRINRVVLNGRYRDKNCALAVGRTLQHDDTWRSEKSFRPPFNYETYCGKTVDIYVATDRGTRIFSFKKI